jgi:hypothetical protein
MVAVILSEKTQSRFIYRNCHSSAGAFAPYKAYRSLDALATLDPTLGAAE